MKLIPLEVFLRNVNVEYHTVCNTKSNLFPGAENATSSEFVVSGDNSAHVAISGGVDLVLHPSISDAGHGLGSDWIVHDASKGYFYRHVP